jgi:phosphinothricin acetyltransferase
MNEQGRHAFILKRLESKDLNKMINDKIKMLFEQLNSTITQLTVEEVLTKNETVFIGCWHENEIVGMALMATYKVISGHKGMIEDVVVNEHYRGKGIGKKLMLTLLKEADTMNLDEILLFTGHHRKAAISLYTSLGFKLKDSGLYRLELN